jgi:hypothetical protein
MHDYAFAAKRFTRNAAQLTNILFSFQIFGSKILFAMQQTELDNQALQVVKIGEAVPGVHPA